MKLWMLALVASLGGCDREPGDAGKPVTGAALFASLCAACHGPDGRPPEAMIVRLGVHDLTAPEFRVRVTPGLVEHQVRKGSKTKLMPAFEGALDDAQIKAVAAYVASPQFLARP